MGKLNIAHHKSYHPYRRDNIERVRQDEEEARLKEEKEEGRMMLADAEARLSLLRDRSGGAPSAKSKRKEDDARERELLAQAADPSLRIEAVAGPSSLSALGGGKHINLFEELEQGTISSALTKTRELDKLGKKNGKDKMETEKGVPLAPSAKDLKPWYSEKSKDSEEGKDDERRTRDLSHKSRSDPLAAIQRELATRYPPSSSSTSSSYQQTNRRREWGGPPSHAASARATPEGQPDKLAAADPERSAREARESSERARALALIARKKRELAGSATPSTVRGGEDTFRYGDQFNSRAVAEAHRRHDMPDVRQRGWGVGGEREHVHEPRGDRDRDRGRAGKGRW
ncbi:hypothetical protein DFH11DRAFT_1572263 [Phellopilus nigrolimitatus]|nr:hypothetical protein DFH11DRAFT_1572263 [Phellopilus nigrolimitatus]